MLRGVSQIIDSHQHFWDINRFSYRWMPPGPHLLRRNFLPPDFESLLTTHGIRGTVLIEAHNSLDENAFLFELAERYAFVLGVVGWVDLQANDIGFQLEHWSQHPKLKGIRHQVESEPDDMWLIREKTIAGLKLLAERGLCYDLVVQTKHLKFIPEIARQVPDLKMVLDHIGKPPIAAGSFQPWADEIAQIAAFPNIWCKFSGMVTESDPKHWNVGQLRPYAAHVREVFGIGRLMWGSDWPVCLKAASYDAVLDSAVAAIGALDATEQRMLMHENAINFYNLALN